MITVVYRATGGDGRAPGYLEAAITDANDLPNIKANVGATQLAPAPGSIAYTPGMAEIYQVDVDGVWTQI